MLYLTEPAWLWVIAGIIAPVLIHLARGRSGKTFAVGSIRFLKENILSQSISVRIREIILLLLRCIGIILTALLLSKPVWRIPFPRGSKYGWVIVEKNRTRQSLIPYRAFIDSVLHDGYELHLLKNEFPLTTLQEILSVNGDSSANDGKPYWQTLAELQEKIPGDMPVYLFTGHRLNRFSGNRPELHLNLKWFFTEDADSMRHWNAGSYLTSGDSLAINGGVSYSRGTWFQQKFQNRKIEDIVSLDQIAPDSHVLRVLVFCDSVVPDADYVISALHAVQQYTGHRMQILRTGDIDSAYKQADWLFWLSEKEIPAATTVLNVFRYQPGTGTNADTHIYSAGSNAEPAIGVSRIVESNNDPSSKIVWNDGFGRTVLSVKGKNARIYTFFSHFNPSWTELPWLPRFPYFILNLLYPESLTKKDTANDIRVISKSQALPQNMSVGNAYSGPKYKETELSSLTWILLCFIFVIERWLSLIKRRAPHA